VYSSGRKKFPSPFCLHGKETLVERIENVCLIERSKIKKTIVTQYSSYSICIVLAFHFCLHCGMQAFPRVLNWLRVREYAHICA